ncbi:hypothetical protein GGX14DRAFT_394591 [Mycena pura]|uniref:Uncharacterized protein n=1 Tax=Mycena pura TaxID=153505 RepID=A0AAD6VE24_9AGAR|nr:hypothetical protein GGX14DRAFT_394591 [Mycena pura]
MSSPSESPNSSVVPSTAPIHWISARVCDPPRHPAGGENTGMLLVVYDGARPGLYTDGVFALRSAQHAQPLNEVVPHVAAAYQPLNEVVPDVAAAYRAWHANCFLRHTGEFHHLHGLHTHEQPMEDHVLYGAPISEEELDPNLLVSSTVVAATSLKRYVAHPDPDHDLDVFQCARPDPGHDLDVFHYARGEAPHPEDIPAFRMHSVAAEEQDHTTLPTPVSPVRFNGRTHIVRDWTPSRRADLLALQQRLEEEQLQAPPSSPVSDEVHHATR